MVHVKKKWHRKGSHCSSVSGTFMMLFSATGCIVRHENTRRWMV